MLKTQKLTREFMAACGLEMSPTPTSDINFEKLVALVEEECEEFAQAMARLKIARSSDSEYKTIIMADIIDAMCDLIVVIHNTSNAMGIDLEPFFEEVHEKNMEKRGGPKREDGKQLKPEGWTPPDHLSLLKMITGVPIERQANKVRNTPKYLYEGSPLDEKAQEQGIVNAATTFIHACIMGDQKWSGCGDVVVSGDPDMKGGMVRVVVRLEPTVMPSEFRANPEWNSPGAVRDAEGIRRCLCGKPLREGLEWASNKDGQVFCYECAPEPQTEKDQRVEKAKEELEAYREDLAERMNEMMSESEDVEEPVVEYCEGTCEKFGEPARIIYDENVARCSYCMRRVRPKEQPQFRGAVDGRVISSKFPTESVDSQRPFEDLLLDALYFVIANMKREEGSVLDQKCKEMMERIEDGKQ